MSWNETSQLRECIKGSMVSVSAMYTVCDSVVYAENLMVEDGQRKWK